MVLISGNHGGAYDGNFEKLQDQDVELVGRFRRCNGQAALLADDLEASSQVSNGRFNDIRKLLSPSQKDLRTDSGLRCRDKADWYAKDRDRILGLWRRGAHGRISTRIRHPDTQSGCLSPPRLSDSDQRKTRCETGYLVSGRPFRADLRSSQLLGIGREADISAEAFGEDTTH